MSSIGLLRERVRDLARAFPRTPALFIHGDNAELLAGRRRGNDWRLVVGGLYGDGDDGRPWRALYRTDAHNGRVADLGDVLQWFARLLPKLPHSAIRPETRATTDDRLRGACALLDLALASRRPNLCAERWRWHTLADDCEVAERVEALEAGTRLPGLIAKRLQPDVLADWYANPAALWRAELPDVYYALVEAIDELESPAAPAAPAAAAAEALDAIDAEALLAPARLAALAGVPAEALRLRLRRWREKNLDGWVQNSERGPREAEYLYRVGAVRPVVEELRATTGATGERPASGK